MYHHVSGHCDNTMYLGNKPPRRRSGSNPIRVLILIILIGIGLYVLTVKPEAIPRPFQPTPTPTRTAANYASEAEDFYREGQLTAAIEAYEQAIRRDPIIIENYIPLVRLLVFQSRFDEARDYADTALFVDPDYAAAHAIRGMTMDWQSSQLADQGREREAAELLREALSEVNKAIETDPTSAEAYAYLAEILFDMGNYTQADEAIDTALLLDAKSLEAQRIAGYLMELRGYREEAIAHYQEAIRLHPKLAMLHFVLGRTYVGTGDVNLAVDSLETTIELDSENPEYLYWLGYTYFTIGERDFAADYFQQALEIKPDLAKAHCQLGLIYYQQRNWEGAIPELEMGVEGYGELLTYRNAFCYYTLGLSYFYVARCQDAYPLFEQVLELIPENAPALEGVRLCKEAEAQNPAVTPTPSP